MNIIEENMEEICKIELKNRKKEIVGYALVDKNDYEEVIKYNWVLCKTGYVCTNINKKKILLSHFIYGKPRKGYVIDHINNNKLDNKRSNLREATFSQNSQNRKKMNAKNTTSQYIGVRYKDNKWEVCCSNTYLGRYDDEIEAAKIYDKYVLIKYGKDASTNNLVNYNEIENITIEEILPEKIQRNLPKNIFFDKNKYIVAICHNKIKYQKCFNSLEEAKKCLELFKDEINDTKIEQDKEHYNKEIQRDDNNNAIIPIYNKNKEFINNIIVDDDKWHDLTKYNWCSRRNYIQGIINGKNVLLHRYLLNAPDDKLVDHINGNTFDNRLCNLRLVTNAENNYNLSKNLNTSSKYKGVSKRTGFNNYIVSIQKDEKYYNLGLYYNEDIAGLAYNLKAEELFGEFAKLNKIDIDQETYENYKDIIFNEWNKEKKQYKGVYYVDNKYEARITKDDKLYVIGRYEKDIIAAIAYNLKIIEMNGKKHNLNNIDIDKETYDGYKKIIIDKWNNKKILYNGVSIRKEIKNNKYRARIRINNKLILLGQYDTEIKAAIAYNIKAVELLGNKAKLNDINLSNDEYEKIKEEILPKLNKLNI